MYCFSLKPVKSPVYYFPFPGNSPDLSNIGYCIKEAGIKNVVLIADKGFRDDANSMLMKENGIIFLAPLKRNDSSIDYGFMGEQAGTAVPFGANVFTYHGRAICFRTIQEYEYKDVRKKRASRGRPKADEKPEYEEIRQDKIVLFLDTELKNEEESTRRTEGIIEILRDHRIGDELRHLSERDVRDVQGKGTHRGRQQSL